MSVSASPAIQLSADGVTWNAPGVKLSVASGGTVYARLDSISNVDSTSWKVLSTDNTTTPSSFTLTPGGGIVNSTVSFVTGGVGTAGILQSSINGLVDKTTGTVNPLTTTATVKWWVAATNGAEAICFDEHGESGPNWWLPLVNAAIKGSAGVNTGTITLGSQSPPQYALSAQPSVAATTGAAVNLLTTPLSIPVGNVVVVRSVVIGRITTPTQGSAALLTSIAELGDVAGSPVVIFGGPVSQETNVPTQPWGSSFGGQLSAMVTGAADNGAGLIRLQFANTNNGMATGNTLAIANVGGVPAATGSWTITNVGDSTHIDLQGSAFAGSYTSGGTAVPQAASGVALVGGTNIQFQATGITPANWIQSQSVHKNDLRIAGGNIYTCSTQGTTASTGSGPTGTGTGISDNTAAWDYVGAASAGITVTWTVCKLEVFSG